VAAQPDTALRNPKVLIVDDDADLRRLLEVVFVREGYRVCIAPDGPSALELVDAERPDVILLDLMMPGMDGFTVLQRLKRRVRSPRIVCLTAKGSTMDREKAWRLGIDEYVTKPFAIDQIFDAITAVVGRSWPERRARRHRALQALRDGQAIGD
jgi:DNA-binding response OmpR family regulator